MPDGEKSPIIQEQREISDGRLRRLANLRPFQPGQSGNPGGRRKGRSVTARVEDILGRTEFDGKPIPGGRCVADLLAESIVRHALRGDFRYAKEILDRMDGKVPDRVVDETPEFNAERDRAELASLIATITGRAGEATPIR